MKVYYSAPVAAARGDVVRLTLGSKPVNDEAADMTTKPSGGSNLSFGL